MSTNLCISLCFLHCLQNDNPTSVPSSSTTTQHLELPTACNTSITSSNQTLNSLSSNRTATTCKTLTPLVGQTRRLSDSDASDLKYFSLSSEPSSAGACVNPSNSFESRRTQEIGVQTDNWTCSCCGALVNKSTASREWQINNLPYIDSSNVDNNGNKAVIESPLNSADANTSPRFFIINGSTEGDSSANYSCESVGQSSDDLTTSVSVSDQVSLLFTVFFLVYQDVQ